MPPLSSAERWRAAAVCIAVAALTILDLTKVNVALPSIESSLDAGPSELQFIVAGYALAFGLALVPAGRLGDMWSRRGMFLIGLSLFLVSSLWCGLAPDTDTLIAARLAQGVAAGIQMPQVIGLMQQLFTGAERGRAFGVFGATIGIATAFGPTIGGLLIGIAGPEDGWRWIFWMNVPLVLIVVPFALKLLPRREGAGERQSLDLIGVAILGVAIVSVMLPFALTTGRADDDPARWLLLVPGALAILAFVWWERSHERRGHTPVVRLALVRLRSFRNGALIATAYFAAMPGVFLVTTLFLQTGLDLAPVYAGMVSIPFALASAVTSWYGGRLVTTYGRPLVVLGLVVVILGFGALAIVAVTVPPAAVPWAMAVAMLVAGVGGGFVIAPNQTLTLAEVPLADGGVAGSMSQLGQRVGNAMGTATATAAFFGPIAGAGLAGADLDVFHEAVGHGILVALAFLAGALILAIGDWRRRAAPSAA